MTHLTEHNQDRPLTSGSSLPSPDSRLPSPVFCLSTPSLPTFINFLFHLSKNFPNIVPIMKLVKDIVTTRLRDIDPTKA
jgi:hypothetical protein